MRPDYDQVRRVISTIVKNDKFLIKDKETGEARQIDYGDIMVITGTKRRIPEISSWLNTYDIPVRTEGRVNFSDCESLKAIFDVYSAVSAPCDKRQSYKALTGDLFDVDDGHIAEYIQAGNSISIMSNETECDNKLYKYVSDAMNVLRRLYRKTDNMTPSVLYSAILEETDLFRSASAHNLELLYFVLELLRRGEKDGSIVTLEDGKNYLNTLLAGESGEERALTLKDNVNAVHIANLHKVKGLEAPVVILTHYYTSRVNPDFRIEHTDDGAEAYLMQKTHLFGFQRVTDFSTTAFDDKKDAESVSLKEEIKRLIYVAATRARNVLIISENKKANRNGTIKTETNWVPLLRDRVPDFFKTVSSGEGLPATNPQQLDSEELYKVGKDRVVLSNRNGENSTYELMLPSHERTVSVLSGETEQDNSSDEMQESSEKSVVHKYPAILGTMVHKLMETIISSGNCADINLVAKEIVNEYHTGYTKQYDEEFQKALIGVAEKIRNGGYAQENGMTTDILNTLLSADNVYCEMPFCYRDGDVIWNGVMDIVYVKDGSWHIVDYKTNADGSDLDEKYQNQLAAYIRALKALVGVDADAFAYHIDI